MEYQDSQRNVLSPESGFQAHCLVLQGIMIRQCQDFKLTVLLVGMSRALNRYLVRQSVRIPSSVFCLSVCQEPQIGFLLVRV